MVRIGLREQGNPVNQVYPLDDPSKWPKWIPGRIGDKWVEVTTEAILEMVGMFGGIPQVQPVEAEHEVIEVKVGGKLTVHDVDLLEKRKLPVGAFHGWKGAKQGYRGG